MKQHDFSDLAVAATYKSYPGTVRRKLLALRQLIFETAEKTSGVGPVQETLKWGVPSYQDGHKNGTPIRLEPTKKAGHYGLYVHCQTSLINEFRQACPHSFEYSGTRALLFGPEDQPPKRELEEFITKTLIYHRRQPRNSSSQ
ncbi:MAG: DUF1801 domain-containing protein [Sneathiella sp.]|nr:DUF1801 domain-containing protein [Sneathiella sp.]